MELRAKTVANLFLSEARASKERGERNPPVTPMSIQKLVYIAHGYNLGATGRPLIAEKVFAWDWGPVIPDLYHAFKRFGNGEIEADAIVEPEVVDADTAYLVSTVWDVYRRFTASQLSKMTHAPGTPWSKTVDGKSPIPFDLPIENQVIEEYYAAIVKRGRKA